MKYIKKFDNLTDFDDQQADLPKTYVAAINGYNNVVYRSNDQDPSFITNIRTSQLVNDANFVAKPEADEAYAARMNIGALNGLVGSDGFMSNASGNVYALPDAASGDEDDVLATKKTLKTINGASIIGSGNITIESSSTDNLHPVATSGSYNDLSNKPTIPTKTSELENDSNYIVVDTYGDASINGTMWCNQVNSNRFSTWDDIGLEFDSSGISIDMGGGIKFLSITRSGDGTKYLADDGTYKTVSGGSGTITGISANGTSIATSGVANIPAASTSKYGVTKLSSATNSTSTTLAATASAVKTAYDLANSYKGTVTGVKVNGTTKSPTSGVVDLGTVITSHQDISGKQDKLVSGTNIKTINGTSILGSGNITISGGSSSGGSGVYAEVNHGTSDTTFTLTPNTFHVWEEVSALTLTLGSETSGVANEFLFQFTSGDTATTLSLPSDLKWVEELVVEPNMIYQVSILKGLASVLSWSDSTELKDNFIDIQGNELRFQYPTTSELSIDVYGRTTGMPSDHVIVVPSGSSSYVASNLSTILYINSVSPSSDSTYNYIFQMS